MIDGLNYIGGAWVPAQSGRTTTQADDGATTNIFPK